MLRTARRNGRQTPEPTPARRSSVARVAYKHEARNRYLLAMAHKPEVDRSDSNSRLADSGEKAIRNLVALPLRMLIGALHIMEAPLQNAVATLREIDPRDERFVELEGRVVSLEEQATLQSSRATTAARQRTPTAASVEPERVE
jgi:hypothetical protein